jgi:uncharacterized protein (TIGR03067 family)
MSAKFPWLLVALLSLAADDPAGDRAKKELAALQGSWELISFEAQGEPEDFADRAPRWVIKSDKVFYGGDELAALTIDPSTNPKCLDLGFLKPKKVYEAVYRLDGDTLKICLNRQTEGVKERPTEFATKGKTDFRLMTFRRAKPGEVDKLGLGGFVGVQLRIDRKNEAIGIADVIEGSPAKKAGLKKDDVLIQVAGMQPTGLRSVVDTIRKARPGSEIALRVRRGDKEREISVKVGVVPFYLLD